MSKKTFEEYIEEWIKDSKEGQDGYIYPNMIDYWSYFRGQLDLLERILRDFKNNKFKF